VSIRSYWLTFKFELSNEPPLLWSGVLGDPQFRKKDASTDHEATAAEAFLIRVQARVQIENPNQP
jgi:hypothetical protein